MPGIMKPTIEPIKDKDGGVVLVKDERTGTLTGQIFRIIGGQNVPSYLVGTCLLRTLPRSEPGFVHLTSGGDGQGQARSYNFYHLYRKPSGDIFHFPIELHPDNQTTNRWVGGTNGPTSDLYLEKAGWRYATPEDVVDGQARSVRNAKEAADRKRAEDPRVQAQRTAEIIAEAIKANSEMQLKPMGEVVAMMADLHKQAGQQSSSKGR